MRRCFQVQGPRGRDHCGSQESAFSYDSGAECGSRAAGLFGVPASALREVAALKSLAGHPNIVTLRDVFVEAQGRIFTVSEYVPCDLRGHLGTAPVRCMCDARSSTLGS